MASLFNWVFGQYSSIEFYLNASICNMLHMCAQKDEANYSLNVLENASASVSCILSCTLLWFINQHYFINIMIDKPSKLYHQLNLITNFSFNGITNSVFISNCSSDKCKVLILKTLNTIKLVQIITLRSDINPWLINN